MSTQPVRKSNTTQNHRTPSSELAKWLGPCYRPKSEAELAAGYNPHPWPSPGRQNRQDAVYRTALDCLKRGYPVWHATLAIRDWNASNPPAMDVIDLAQLVLSAYKSASADAPTDLGDSYLRLSEHCSDEILPRPWLVPGILPAGQRTALVGKWGSGKSWLALDMAMAIVFGSKFLGDTPAAVRGPVVILDGEGGRLRAVNRFNQLRTGRGIPSRSHLRHMDIHWFSLEDFNLSWEDAAAKLSHLLNPLEPVLIVMDTLAKVMGLPDENSNAAAAQVTRALYALNQNTNAALLLLAHPAKTVRKDTSVRGAGELSADLDVLWNIQRGANQIRKARCEKDRDPDLENCRFDFSIESWKTGTRLTRHEPHPDSTLTEDVILAALKSAPTGLKRTDLVLSVKESCGLGRATTYNAILNLTNAGALIERDHRLSLAAKPDSPVSPETFQLSRHPDRPDR
jgi:AAA domain